MRFIRNEIQTPKLLVAQEKRRSIFFFFMVAGIIFLIMGFLVFFVTFHYQNLVEERWGVPYRRVQTYALAFGGAGIILYIVGALVLKVPLRKTTYYKLQTIVKNEPFDPPRKGDFTKPVYARLRDLDDEWALFTEINPPDADFIIPQVIAGPGGVFATFPINQNPQRRAFEDPGPELEKAGRKLGSALNTQVLPIIVFATPKLVQLYKENFKARTRVMHIREIFDYFDGRKEKFSEKQRKEIEAKVFEFIKGTPPG